MYSELSEYYVSLEKSFLHIPNKGLSNKVSKVPNLYYPRENPLQSMSSCDQGKVISEF